MKLNGALKPHRGAPAIGCSNGAKKYRDKRHSTFRPCWRHVQNQFKCKDRLAQQQQQQPQRKLAQRENVTVIVTTTSRRRKFKLMKEVAVAAIEEEEEPNDYYKSNTNSNNNNQKLVLLKKERCVRNTQKGSSLTSTEIFMRQLQRQQQQHQSKKGGEFLQKPAKSNGNVKEVNSTLEKTVSVICQNVINAKTVKAEAPASKDYRARLNTLLMPLISFYFDYNIVESMKAIAMNFMRVQQSFVPKKISRRSIMAQSRQAADVTRGKTSAVSAAAMVSDPEEFVGKRKKYESVVFYIGWCLRPSMVSKIALCFLTAFIALLPQAIICDESDNFFAVNSFSMGPETTTTEFDYASRGQKKFGDKCENTLECGFPGSICDPKKKSCQCTDDLPVTNHIDKCGKEAAVNESCFFNEQCEVKYFQTECRDGRCICRFEMTPIWGKDGSVECKGRQEKRGPETYIDPAMIGVLVGMALMFVIICVVLRLFSQARWRENRTIFNTPNPRLMNVSLLRDSKLLHGQERRGSRMSVRVPSRQPSMASLRPHSPNPSLGRMTRSKSNTRSSESRVSDVSNCSRLLEHPNAQSHGLPQTHSAHSPPPSSAQSPPPSHGGSGTMPSSSRNVIKSNGITSTANVASPSVNGGGGGGGRNHSITPATSSGMNKTNKF